MRINILTKICLIWGVFWGVLSYAVYFLGLMGLWYKPVLWGTLVLAIAILIWYLRRAKIVQDVRKFFERLPAVFKQEKWLFVPLIIILAFIILNFIGAIAPEKEFDALWYHLTIPKIYLFDHSVHFIPGGLFYYSVMPRLSEMLYGLTLSFDLSGIFAKILHFSFGLMWAVFSFQTLRMIFNRTISAWLTLVIYSLLIVSHLSGTTYIDLIVCFYAAGAIWGFLNYLKTDKTTYMYLMALFLGFNLSSKLYGAFLALTLGLYLLYHEVRHHHWRELIIAALIIIALPSVYWLNAYLATGNPIYPVGSIRDSSFDLWIRGATTYREWLLKIWPTKILALFWWALVYCFAPVFGLIFLVPLTNLKKNPLILPTLITFLMFFIFWSLLPVWEPRYLMVVLPLMAILTGWVITEFKSIWFKIGVVVLIGWGLIYNFNLSYKNFQHPIELARGQITRSAYLEKYIGGVWYNFYDLEGFFAKNLKPGERVLTVDYHNLFYAPFGFIDWSEIQKKFDSAGALSDYLKQKNIKYVTLDKISLSDWSGLSQEDLDQYFTLVWHNEEREYFLIK